MHLQFLSLMVGTEFSTPVVILQNISSPGDDFENFIAVNTIESNATGHQNARRISAGFRFNLNIRIKFCRFLILLINQNCIISIL